MTDANSVYDLINDMHK